MKLKLNNLTIYVLLFIYILYQIYLSSLGGATYDQFAQWLGAGYIFEKVQAYKNFDFNNIIFDQELNTFDFFGYFFMLPAFIFERVVNRVSFNEFNKPMNSFAENFLYEDALTYFSLHFFLIIYSFICLIFILKKIEKIYNRNLSLLFLITILFIPSFSGHLIFNIKDIPFLFQLFISKLFLYDYLINKSGNLSYRKKIILGFLIAASMSIRINAILFILFFILFLYLTVNDKKIYLKNISSIFLLSIIFLFLMNPQSWKDPLLWITSSMDFQSNHPWTGNTLTNGDYIFAQNMNGSYLFSWYFYRMPIFIHICIIFSLIKLIRKQYINRFSLYSLVFIITNFLLFPLIKPTAYDGLRHFLFLIPFFVVSCFDLFKYIESKNYKKIILGTVVLYSIFTQYGLEQYKYTYFNEFVNLENVSSYCENIDGCGDWPTDYWAFSGKEISQYVNKNFNQEDLLLCKPRHSFTNYIELDRFNDLMSDEITTKNKNFIVVSSHRPRLNDDSCGFKISGLRHACSELYTLKKTYRFTDVNMSYISKCSASSKQ
tara:strand:+ start:832 stop:2466 length:1635 start_codon:yes stop_codon:yes gene_type:complete